jgi:hypothetical protein
MIKNVLIAVGLLYTGAIMEKKFGILGKTTEVAKKAEGWLFTTNQEDNQEPTEETK